MKGGNLHAVFRIAPNSMKLQQIMWSLGEYIQMLVPVRQPWFIILRSTTSAPCRPAHTHTPHTRPLPLPPASSHTHTHAPAARAHAHVHTHAMQPHPVPSLPPPPHSQLQLQLQTPSDSHTCSPHHHHHTLPPWYCCAQTPSLFVASCTPLSPRRRSRRGVGCWWSCYFCCCFWVMFLVLRTVGPSARPTGSRC
jgi:hypothetical protein